MAMFNLKSEEFIVDEASKRQFNEQHFDEAASRYDLATIGLSLGQDSSWKKKLISLLENENPKVAVDLASGTGDVTRAVAKRFPNAKVCGVDLSQEMVLKAEKINNYSNASFIKGDMTRLPFLDGSVDLVTGSYALRNAPNIEEAIKEVSRVLSSGGLAVILDFVKAEQPRKAAFQQFVLKYWGGFWGFILHGNKEVHGYIATSLKNFPSLSKLDKIFNSHQLQLEQRKLLFGGMISLSSYRKR